MTAPLSPREAAIVTQFDAAPDAPESLLDRVAKAIHDADDWDCSHEWPCPNANLWRRLAVAAIAVMRGES